MSEINFPSANAPDILRAAQKDEHYLKFLRNEFLEHAKSFFGARFQMKYTLPLIYVSDLIYHSVTTLQGSQTLGEEYADIIAVYNNVKPTFTVLIINIEKIHSCILLFVCSSRFRFHF
jgi:peroxin-10